jgi:hypothetical protein
MITLQTPGSDHYENTDRSPSQSSQVISRSAHSSFISYLASHPGHSTIKVSSSTGMMPIGIRLFGGAIGAWGTDARRSRRLPGINGRRYQDRRDGLASRPLPGAGESKLPHQRYRESESNGPVRHRKPDTVSVLAIRWNPGRRLAYPVQPCRECSGPGARRGQRRARAITGSIHDDLDRVRLRPAPTRTDTRINCRRAISAN